MTEKKFIIREDQLEEINYLWKKHSILAIKEILKQLPILKENKKEAKNNNGTKT